MTCSFQWRDETSQACFPGGSVTAQTRHYPGELAGPCSASLPAEPYLLLSHVTKQQPAGERKKKKLSSSATQTLYASLTFSPFESPKDSLRRKVGWPRFNDLSTLSKIAFNLTLMASDKCPGWLQERSVLIRRLPVISHLVCSLFYKCHCHILLNICLSFLGW